jgi:polysaccharide biosynthesis protein VpsJ
MSNITEYADSFPLAQSGSALKSLVYDSIQRLSGWLEKYDYRGYDTFDGLNAKYLRPLTFENKYLRMALQQGVRRFPLNLRPVLGIGKSRSSKGMGFLARGFIRLHQASGDAIWRDKAVMCLHWLVENQSPGYNGACWGNHFDYQSRSVFERKFSPSVVWTSHIGHAFIDAYEHLRNEKYLEVAISSCEHILKDLGSLADGEARCINYFPTSTHQVHNANVLGGGLLARTYLHTHNEAYRDLAERSMLYTAKYQHDDGAWDYGELPNLRWVDNFHTAYVLDCFKYYEESTGDEQFDANMMRGYEYWKETFFLADGTPRYYSNRTRPLDIQCSSQAIETLTFFADRDPESVPLAIKVSEWTIRNMQDKGGYFYYRRYPAGIVNKTPMLHWGQATMFCALAGLLTAL